MLPISPNIEGIPEKRLQNWLKDEVTKNTLYFGLAEINNTRHTMRKQVFPQVGWRQPTMNGFNQTDFLADWIPASLNCISGDIDNSHNKADEKPEQWIKGYYFIITNNSNRDIAFA